MSFSMSWSIFWRVFALEFIVAMVFLIFARNTALFAETSLVIWKPSVIWALLGCVLLAGQVALPNGLVHVLWGARLGKPNYFWRAVGYGSALVAFGIALLNLLLAKVVSFELWVQLKTFGPLILLAAFTFAVQLWLAKRSNPSLQRTASPPAEL